MLVQYIKLEEISACKRRKKNSITWKYAVLLGGVTSKTQKTHLLCLTHEHLRIFHEEQVCPERLQRCKISWVHIHLINPDPKTVYRLYWRISWPRKPGHIIMYAHGICLGLFITSNLLNTKPRGKFEPVHGHRFFVWMWLYFFLPPTQQYS